VSKTVSGTTTYYLVDDRNPSGYAQVLEEYQGTSLSRVYNYGLALISQRQVSSGTISYYGTDGHGSTRFLTVNSGAVTDTYTFDAYGLMIASASSGSTPNNYLYCGQQWDADVSMYYLRARYYRPDTGRFWTMDTYDGDSEDPLSLHKYLYAQASPIDLDDPSGNYSGWEQFMGYEAQDAIVDHYKDTHPWINPDDIVSEAHVPVKSRKYAYLKPDIINVATKQWLEIKPLSVWGIAKGAAKYELDKKLLKGYSPDAGWTPLLELETDSGEAILVVNCGGIVYWVDKDFVTDSAGFAAGVAAGAVADQLLKFVAQQVAVRSLAPLAVRSTAFLAEAFSADLGATLGVASLNTLESGGAAP
jgi:RHS repeat-associated protein